MNNLILPHDLDAEIGLLNAVCCPTGFERVLEIVGPDDFYSEGGRLIFSKMLEFYQSRCKFTLYQIDQSFEDHPDYLNIRRILDELLPVTAESARHFAKIVKELSGRRKSIKKAYTTYIDLHDPANPLPSNLLQSAMAGGG